MLRFKVVATVVIVFCTTNLFAETENTPLYNSARENMLTMAKITDAHPLLIKNKVSPEQVAANLSAAEVLLSKVEETCERMGYPELLKAQGKYEAAAKAEGCRSYRHLALSWIANMKVKTANYYASNGNKAAAKKLYREVIIRFTGDEYKSQAKEAEFGLEDLK